MWRLIKQSNLAHLRKDHFFQFSVQNGWAEALGTVRLTVGTVNSAAIYSKNRKIPKINFSNVPG